MSAGWERVAGDVGGTVGGLASAPVAGGSLVFAATSVGVFRSSDGGQTWVLAGIRNTVPLAEVVAPSAHFAQDHTLFACASDGLYRSSDSGDSWQPVLVGSRMLSVASGVGVLLAGTDTDGVLRSEDAGRTWSGANAGLLDLTALALALSPQFAADHLGFAGTASGLYRTRNAARSWRVVETGLAESAVQCVTVSPSFADDRLVLAGTESDGLLRSEDAGATWRRPPTLLDRGVTALAFSTRYPTKPTIAAAVESGVALSDDGGRTWRMTTVPPPGMVLSLSFVATPNGEALLAGLHRQGVARSEDDGASWRLANTGLSARLLTGLSLSPAFTSDGTLFVAGPQDGVEVSMDHGRTWAERNAGLEDSSVLGLAVSPGYATDRTVYVATADGLYVSRDGAALWQRTPEPAATVRMVAAVRGSGDEAPPIILIGVDGCDLLVSEDGATTWRASGPINDGAEIIALAPSPNYARDRTIFVATSGRGGEVVVWRTVDGGARWVRWPVDLDGADGRFVALAVSPNYALDGPLFVGRAADLGGGATAVTALVVSPGSASDRTVFAATNAGVFVARDGGDTYQPWSEGLVPPAMVALAISPSYSDDRLVYGLGLGGTIWRRRD